MTVSETRLKPHIHECDHETTDPHVCRCVVCGKHIGFLAPERAEPSRGAPDARQFYDSLPEETKYRWLGSPHSWAFPFAELYAKSGHVVLLEALRRLTEDFFPKTCKHNGEPWYCDACRFEWEKEFALRKVLAEAAIKQAERGQ